MFFRCFLRFRKGIWSKSSETCVFSVFFYGFSANLTKAVEQLRFFGVFLRFLDPRPTLSLAFPPIQVAVTYPTQNSEAGAATCDWSFAQIRLFGQPRSRHWCQCGWNQSPALSQASQEPPARSQSPEQAPTLSSEPPAQALASHVPPAEAAVTAPNARGT